jgi:uncharacterized lipoprotein YmbA
VLASAVVSRNWRVRHGDAKRWRLGARMVLVEVKERQTKYLAMVRLYARGVLPTLDAD